MGSATTVKAAGTQGRSNNNSLNDAQEILLAKCEQDIHDNLRATFVLGWRLEQIRDQNLYRASHNTFEAYCKERWDFSKTHANRQIQAYLCEKHLKETGDAKVCIPTKESQVRWIVDLEPDQQVEVAAKVKENVGDGEATTGDFGEARQELYPKAKAEVKPKKSNATESKENGSNVVPLFDTNLVSFSELKEQADRLYTIFTSPTGKQEGLKIIGKFQKVFEQLADAQGAELKEVA